MVGERSSRGRGDTALAFVSFLAFFTTLPVYSPNVMVLQSIDTGDLTGYFAEPCLIWSFATCLVVAFGSLMHGRFGVLLCGRRSAPLCALLYAAGAIGFATVIYLQPASGAWLNALFALLTGVSVLPVALAWSRALGSMGLRGAIVLVAFTGICSAAVDLVLGSLSRGAVYGVYLVLLCAGLAYPVAKRFRQSSRWDDAQDSAPVLLAGDAAPHAHEPVNLRAFVSVMGVSLLGMAISSFAMGVQPVWLFGNAIDAQRVGMMVGGLALVPLAVRRSDRPLYSFAYQVYLPGIAMVALVLCSFPSTTFVRELALGVVYSFYAMTSGLAVASAIAVANAREFPRTFVFAALLGAFCGMGYLGIFLGGHFGFLSSNNPVVLVVMTAVYGGAMLFSGCVKAWHHVVEPSSDDPAVDRCRTSASVDERPAQESFDELVSRIAEESGLSPREKQIMGYIGKGHSSVYVAKTLLISESTVYSHVRNIYRKLGISGREELIQMFDANGGGGEDA